MSDKKLRMGMVGGGEGSFIGAIHRRAAALDGEIELVCGAFSGDAERALRSGRALFLPEQRIYRDYAQMMHAEKQLPADQRMDFVVIVTPNDLHLPVALAALEQGFHILSDKPATLNLEQCLRLREALRGRELLYGLTHPYSGYPMVREARARIAAGELGRVRKIVVDYAQGWLAGAEELAGNKQAQWRVDPVRSGASACMGDIGVHAAHLAEYAGGLHIAEVCADLTTFVPGRALDDDGSVLLRFTGGARGILHASQICCGEENNLTLRIYGEKGGLVWAQQEPNSLWLKWPDRPAQLVRAAGPQLSADARAVCRTPSGHPEGYIEAFANIYRDYAAALRALRSGAALRDLHIRYPDIEAGVRGMAFIEAVVASSSGAAKWHPFPVTAGAEA